MDDEGKHAAADRRPVTRRIVIEVEPVSPAPGSVSQFATRYSAEAKLMVDDEDGTPIPRASSSRTGSDPTGAVVEALDGLRDMLRNATPNGSMCGTPLACVLTGRCEQQFGPRGTACNE